MHRPRGIANNNPGNLRRTVTKWRGMADDQNDPNIISFSHPIYGIRALARVLLSYQEKQGLRSLRSMVNRWAPPVDNDTEAYVSHLSGVLGIAPDAFIRLRHDHHKFGLMVIGIIRHENGVMPYEKHLIDDGIVLATVD